MPSSGVSTLFEKLVLDLNTSSSLNIPPVLNPPEPESIKDLSDLLHSKKRFEERFSELKYMLPFYTIGNEDDLQTVNKEILYLRERQKHGRLRNAIDATWRGISDNNLDSIIGLMQEKRDAAYKNIYKNSIESDILNDGNLDYTEEILKTFDFVVASIHSNLKMSEEKANDRLIKAIENPYTTILGHPTGRLLFQ